jgi:hypothetical protein
MIILTNSMEQGPSWEAYSHSGNLINALPFMELEGSLLSSKEPANSPYPEPDESSPHPQILFLYIITFVKINISHHIRLRYQFYPLVLVVCHVGFIWFVYNDPTWTVVICNASVSGIHPKNCLLFWLKFVTAHSTHCKQADHMPKIKCMKTGCNIITVYLLVTFYTICYHVIQLRNNIFCFYVFLIDDKSVSLQMMYC